MQKKVASCLMATLFINGTVLGSKVKASSTGELSLGDISSASSKHEDIDCRRIFISNQLQKIEKHIFEEINIQDYLIEALEKSSENPNPNRHIFDVIKHKTVINFLDLSRKLLFNEIVGVIFESHRFDNKNYIVDQDMIKLVMNNFAQGLTCDNCKRFAKKLREDTTWLRSMIKLDLIKALNFKLDGAYVVPLRIIYRTPDVRF